MHRIHACVYGGMQYDHRKTNKCTALGLVKSGFESPLPNGGRQFGHLLNLKNDLGPITCALSLLILE